MQSCKEHENQACPVLGTGSSTHEAVSAFPPIGANMITMERNQGWPPGEQSAHWLRPWKSRP